jgi:ParB-like chromosome segregation protein Spo0J
LRRPRAPRTQSIRQFGFLNPAIVDDQNMILAGHGRVEAARLEKLAYVPILRFDHLTEAEKRAYAIADNRIAEQAGWERQLLSLELGELVDLLPIERLDISLTGFETPEIDLLIAGRAKPRSAPEDVPPRPPGHAVTRPGDLWLLGDHRLLCGDPRNADDFGRLMEGAHAAAAFLRSARHARRIGGRGRHDRAPRIRVRMAARCRLRNIASSFASRSAMARAFRLKARFISSAWTGAASAT